MADRKMVILRGNQAGAGTYPDEKGNKIAWPKGALHEEAAREYARRQSYEPVVLDAPGYPQSQTSPQATAALKAFLGDDKVTAFYGFSGGGYNVRHILLSLASNNPTTLARIDLVVVIGAPLQHKPAFEPRPYNEIANKKVKDKNANFGTWDVVYRTNPKKSALPEGLPDGTPTHMFGPDVLLAENPPDEFRDWQRGDD